MRVSRSTLAPIAAVAVVLVALLIVGRLTGESLRPPSPAATTWHSPPSLPPSPTTPSPVATPYSAVSPRSPLFGGKKVIFPLAKDDQEMARYLKGLLESGAFRPVIDRRYRLDQIVDAYRYVETGQKIGNVVISVESSTS